MEHMFQKTKTRESRAMLMMTVCFWHEPIYYWIFINHTNYLIVHSPTMYILQYIHRNVPLVLILNHICPVIINFETVPNSMKDSYNGNFIFIHRRPCNTFICILKINLWCFINLHIFFPLFSESSHRPPVLTPSGRRVSSECPSSPNRTPSTITPSEQMLLLQPQVLKFHCEIIVFF